MIEVGAFEAKNKLGALLDRVEQGEEVIITRHGKAVARLVPNVRQVDKERAQRAFDRMRQRAKEAKIPFDWEEIKQLRDEGRP